MLHYGDTMSPSARRAPRQSLSPLESRVMDLAWRRGEITAEALVRDLGGRLSNPSVRTILRRIEAKGFLTHRLEGRTFVYRPAVDTETVARSALRRLVDRFYKGSVEALIVGMVDGKLIDAEDLRTLSRQIDKIASSDPKGPR